MAVGREADIFQLTDCLVKAGSVGVESFEGVLADPSPVLRLEPRVGV